MHGRNMSGPRNYRERTHIHTHFTHLTYTYKQEYEWVRNLNNTSSQSVQHTLISPRAVSARHQTLECHCTLFLRPWSIFIAWECFFRHGLIVVFVTCRDLSGSSLQESSLAVGTFNGLNSLQTLNLSGNNLGQLNARIFEGLPGLLELWAWSSCIYLNHEQWTIALMLCICGKTV